MKTTHAALTNPVDWPLGPNGRPVHENFIKSKLKHKKKFQNILANIKERGLLAIIPNFLRKPRHARNEYLAGKEKVTDEFVESLKVQEQYLAVLDKRLLVQQANVAEFEEKLAVARDNLAWTQEEIATGKERYEEIQKRIEDHSAFLREFKTMQKMTEADADHAMFELADKELSAVRGIVGVSNLSHLVDMSLVTLREFASALVVSGINYHPHVIERSALIATGHGCTTKDELITVLATALGIALTDEEELDASFYHALEKHESAKKPKKNKRRDDDDVKLSAKKPRGGDDTEHNGMA